MKLYATLCAAALSAAALTLTANAATLIIDDGTFENSVGLGAIGTLSWANRFTAPAGGFTLTSIDVAFADTDGNPSLNGTPFTAAVWSDPNANADPDDAVLLSSLVSTVSNSQLFITNTSVNGGFATYDIPDVLFGAGQNFFVGGTITQATGDFPAALDQTTAAGRSWVQIGGTITGGFTTDSVGFGGNWLVRANGVVTVPEAGAGLLAAFALPALGFVVSRRRAVVHP